MKLKHLLVAMTFLLISYQAESSCLGYTKPDEQPTNDVQLQIEKSAYGDGYIVKVIKKTYHRNIKLSSMSLLQNQPYLEIQTIIYPLNMVDEGLADGTGFSPNKTVSKDELYSYITFWVKNPKDVDNYSVSMTYGWEKSCGSAFLISPVAKLQYDKAQPSATSTVKDQ